MITLIAMTLATNLCLPADTQRDECQMVTMPVLMERFEKVTGRHITLLGNCEHYRFYAVLSMSELLVVLKADSRFTVDEKSGTIQCHAPQG